MVVPAEGSSMAKKKTETRISPPVNTQRAATMKPRLLVRGAWGRAADMGVEYITPGVRLGARYVLLLAMADGLPGEGAGADCRRFSAD